MKIIAIAGLCGSGKSFLAGLLQKRYQGNILDDDSIDNVCSRYCQEGYPPPYLYYVHPLLFLEKYREKLENKILEINGTSTFKKYINKKFIENKIEIIYICLEKDIEQCKLNVEYRNDGREVGPTMKFLDKNGTIPPNAILFPVFRDYDEFVKAAEELIL